MGRPAVSLIFLQPVEASHILGISYGLEGPHVLSTGEHVCALQLGVDIHHRPCHELLFIQLQACQPRIKGPHKVPPDVGNVRDLRDDADGDQLRVYELKALLQHSLALPPGGVIIKKDVEGVFLPVFRVDAVGGEAASQTVGPIMHGDHAPDDVLTGHAPPPREMTAEMAHPDGIRTCPSSFIVSHPFFMCFRRFQPFHGVIR